MTISLSDLAAAIDATVAGDGSARVSGCAAIDRAGPDQVAFLANDKYRRFIDSTRAVAIIVGRDVPKPLHTNLLIADDPYFAFRAAMIELHGFRRHDPPFDAPPGSRISPGAAIHPEAVVGEGTIVHPFVSIARSARVGRNCVLYPGVFIGPEAVVGDDCLLYPGVAVYDRCTLGHRVTLHANTVIGQDGFGYATHQGAHHKIPQHGIVVIEDDVELGAGCAIERAAMGETRIGKGTKFADLISIGHGTTIGAHCLFVSLVGVSGSVDVGNYVVLGGQVGVTGHLSIGDFVQAAGKSAIINSIEPNQKVGGQPAIEFTRAKRNAAAALNLADLARKVKELEKRVKELEQ